jgi:hypothetical protein
METKIINVKESTDGPVKFAFYTINDPKRIRNCPKFVLSYEDTPMMIRGRIALLKLAGSFAYVKDLGHSGGWPNYEMTLMLFDSELDELLKIALEKNKQAS